MKVVENCSLFGLNITIMKIFTRFLLLLAISVLVNLLLLTQEKQEVTPELEERIK
jgi:hypothetical protein